MTTLYTTILYFCISFLLLIFQTFYLLFSPQDIFVHPNIPTIETRQIVYNDIRFIQHYIGVLVKLPDYNHEVEYEFELELLPSTPPIKNGSIFTIHNFFYSCLYNDRKLVACRHNNVEPIVLSTHALTSRQQPGKPFWLKQLYFDDRRRLSCYLTVCYDQYCQAYDPQSLMPIENVYHGKYLHAMTPIYAKDGCAIVQWAAIDVCSFRLSLIHSFFNFNNFSLRCECPIRPVGFCVVI